MQATTNNQDQPIPVVAPQPLNPRRKHVGRWLTLFALALIVGATSMFMLFRDQNSSTVQAAAAEVSITAEGFSPQTIRVKQGQAVTWINNETVPHQIVADPYPSGDSLPSLNSVEPLAEGESYTASFEKRGTYTYHDQLNPADFTATVIVE